MSFISVRSSGQKCFSNGYKQKCVLVANCDTRCIHMSISTIWSSKFELNFRLSSAQFSRAIVQRPTRSLEGTCKLPSARLSQWYIAFAIKADRMPPVCSLKIASTFAWLSIARRVGYPALAYSLLKFRSLLGHLICPYLLFSAQNALSFESLENFLESFEDFPFDLNKLH